MPVQLDVSAPELDERFLRINCITGKGDVNVKIQSEKTNDTFVIGDLVSRYNCLQHFII